MFKIVLMTAVCCGLLAAGACSYSNVQINRDTSTEKSLESATTTNDRVPAGYFKANNLPKVEEGCKMKFDCKKKLKNAETPKPCLRFCAKRMECEDGRRITVPPGHCVELDEAMVAQEYNDCRNDAGSGKSGLGIMPVAMIDFPCQPGYLPDSRGRCREVWQ